jgi:hypothetical protein
VNTVDDPLTERLIRSTRSHPGRTFGIAQGCHLRIAYGSLKEPPARA